MVALPPNPRDLALSRQDSWTGVASYARSPESRPLSRRSGCVSAEPYPPLRFVKFSRNERLETIWQTKLKKKGSRLTAVLQAHPSMRICSVRERCWGVNWGQPACFRENLCSLMCHFAN